MLFYNGIETLTVVSSFLIFSQESFLERGLHISMNRVFIFSEGLSFRWRGHPVGAAPALIRGEDYASSH